MANYVSVLIEQKPSEHVTISFFQNEPAILFKERISQELEKIYPNLCSERTFLYINDMKTSDYSKHMDYYNTFGNLWTFSAPILKYNNLYRLKSNEIDIFNGIIIKTIHNKYLGLHVKTSNDESIENIKTMIQDIEGIPIDLQRLILNGHQQLTHDGTLSDYSIKNGDIINLVLRLRGGDSRRKTIANLIDFVDVSNDRSGTIVKLTKDCNSGRKALCGTNFEIKCKCTPNDTLISNFGYGLYNLTTNKLKCPLCNNIDVKLETVGFVHCEYRIRGMKFDNRLYTSAWKAILQNDLYYFFDPLKSGQTKWKSLTIQSRILIHDDPCAICLEVMNNNRNVLNIKCKHKFHKACITKWYQKEKSCPICRIKLF